MKYRPLRKTWIYFKKGKGELTLLISLYNTYMISKIAENDNITLFLILFLSFFFGSIVVGYVTTKHIATTQTFVNPYIQETILAEIAFREGIISLLKDDPDEAIALIQKSIDIREKWVDRG